MARDILIAGGGLGAVRTAQALRDGGYEGRLTIVSEEAEPPYDRPPLSKEFLLGRVTDEDIRLLPEPAYEELDVDLRLGSAAVALDCESRRLTLAGGEQLGYDDLVIATGARPKAIAALDGLAGVHQLRTAQDARALRAELTPGARVGIVGAGFIGLEIAAVATEIGCRVTVIEATAAPLAMVLGTELGGWVREWHESHGVEFRCGILLAGAAGEQRVRALELADGSSVPVDVVVVGVGVSPNVGWLESSGLELHRGLRCDAGGRTSDPHVFGVGDAVCLHEAGACRVIGHWTAVGDQGSRVAEALLGVDDGPHPPQDGYFWSDQFDLRLQFTGAVADTPQITIAAGAVADRSFVALCADADRVTAVFAMNNPRDFVRNSLAMRRQPR